MKKFEQLILKFQDPIIPSGITADSYSPINRPKPTFFKTLVPPTWLSIFLNIYFFFDIQVVTTRWSFSMIDTELYRYVFRNLVSVHGNNRIAPVGCRRGRRRGIHVVIQRVRVSQSRHAPVGADCKAKVGLAATANTSNKKSQGRHADLIIQKRSSCVTIDYCCGTNMVPFSD